MATTETKILDNIIASRRSLLVGGGAALAALAMPGSANAALTLTAASVTDANILNFALNLEYLEANFYYMAAFGTTIDKPNNASNAAYVAQTPGAAYPAPVIGIGAGTTAAGTTATVTGATQVPFANAAVKSYAIETAIEEGKHVSFLRSALGASAVAQPVIDLSPAGAWATLATAAGVPAQFLPFNPYLNDAYFLLGAYVFEDVGVSAYHGAAPLLQQTTAGKQNLLYAGGILAVEAYHAGLVRTTINALDPTGSLGYIGLTQKISGLRGTLANQAAAVPNANAPYDPNPDDYGLSGGQTSYSLQGTTVLGTQIVDADPTNVIAFARTTNQVLNIVTGGGALTANVAAKGVFFPSGLNGVIA
jgi:hypothetical protein